MYKKAFVALLGIMILALAAPAAAQEKGGKRALSKPGKATGSPAQEKWAMVIQIRKRIQQVAMELQTIQKGVVQKHPELVEKQKALREMVKAGMKMQGIDEEHAMAEVMTLRGMMANADITEKKKEEIMAKLKAKAVALKKAHDKATSVPKVKKAQEEFRKAMEAAMMKSEPRSRKLLEEFYKLRKQLKDLLPSRP